MLNTPLNFDANSLYPWEAMSRVRAVMTIQNRWRQWIVDHSRTP